MAWAARLAAPRAEEALPLRSLLAAITGAASGSHRADERVQSRTSTDWPWIFVWRTSRLPPVPVTRFCVESMSTKARTSAPAAAAPGPGAGPAVPGGPSRSAGRCPGVAATGATERGRGTDPAEQHVLAPCRSRPMSSMLPPRRLCPRPAGRPPGARSPRTPAWPDMPLEQLRQAARSARAITGTRPPCDTIGHRTRHWSARAYATSHCEVSSRHGRWERRTTIIRVQRAPFAFRRRNHH